MKKGLILLPLALLLIGCNKDTPASKPDIPEGDVFFSLKENINTNHNYTLKVTVELAEDTDSPYVDYYYMIDGKAYYTVNPDYSAFYSGYIVQKNQGIVSFDTLVNGEGLVTPGSFYSTNTNLLVSDVYPVCLESIINEKFYYEGEKKYSSTSSYALAVLANFTGFNVEYVEIGEEVAASFSTANIFNVGTDFTLRYYDEETLEPVIQDGRVNIEVINLNSTHFQVVDDYIANPSKTYVAPTSWSEDDIELFNTYFNKKMPPFMTGASYSFKRSEFYDGYKQEKYVITEDYICGDISESYGALLAKGGFTKVNEHKYVIEEKINGGVAKQTYTVEFNYTDPSTPYKGTTLGFYFPGGAFTTTYKYKNEVLIDVDTLEGVNNYIAHSRAKKILPAFPNEGEITRVSSFEDRTAYVSQLYPDGNGYLFVTSLSGFFKLHADNVAKAISFVNKLTTVMTAKGFGVDTQTTFGFISFVDSKDSRVMISDPSVLFEGYIQMQIVVYNNYGDIDDTDYVNMLLIEGQTLDYHVGDTFNFDGTVTAIYESGDTRIVSPTSVSSPDMSMAGNPIVTVTFVENGKTVTKGYRINITHPESSTARTIKYAGGFDGEGLSEHIDFDHSILPSYAEPGESVTMTVALESGYKHVYYPNDATGDVWSQFNDEVVRTKSVTFIMPSYSFEMIILVEESGGEEIDYMTGMTVEGQTTIFEEYSEFVFDGTATVTYESGATKVVTPSIEKYPNMSLQGEQEVIIYYRENYVTVRESYIITVIPHQEKEKYKINIATIDGVSIFNVRDRSTASPITEAEEGTEITFSVSVTSGYTLNRVYYEYNGEKITVGKVSPISSSYLVPSMPKGPITLGAEVTPPRPVQELNGIFFVQYASSEVYEFNFNKTTKTATYKRINPDNSTAVMNFKFEYSTGKFIFTYVSGSLTDFRVGYRLFKTIGGDVAPTNNTLVFSEDYSSFTIEMYNNNSEATTQTFNKY